MMICAYCPRPANNKVTTRDDWQRVRQIYVCDAHDPTAIVHVNGGAEAQKEYMERRGWK